MPSLQALAARALLRATVKWPSAFDTPETDLAIARMRSALERASRLWGRIPAGIAQREIRSGAVSGEWIASRNASPAGAQRILYYLHGGGYVAGSPAAYRSLTCALARTTGANVFALGYRLAPEHRFPAAVADAVAGFTWLLERGYPPKRIAMAGDSAGGGLALATAIVLRDHGLPMPAALALFSPWTDLAGSGASVIANARSEDMLVGRDTYALARAYLGDVSPRDPLASPLYADLRGLPPTLVHASTSELLLDDARRIVAAAQAANVIAALRLRRGLPHAWQVFAFLPETRASLDETSAFFDARWE